MADVVVSLPDDLRAALKEPFGPIYTDPADLLAAVEGPLIAVGDVVTYHIERAGGAPDVAVIDERTERSAVDEEIRAALGEADVVVDNPAATLTDDLLTALRVAVGDDAPVRIRVEGEEDLATLPAILVAPAGASVVYGQPGEGMVHVRVEPAVRERVRGVVGRMDGDPDRLFSVLGV